MRLIAAAIAAFALAGCTESKPEIGPDELLARAVAAVHEQSTFTFTFEYERTRVDEPNDPERYGSGDGAVDLASGRGRIALELDVGLNGADGTYAARWSRTEVEASFGAERERVSRKHAREHGGLLGRLPDEPEALVALLQERLDARRLGERRLGGRQLTVIGFAVDAREAGRLGAPAELSLAAASGTLGDRLALEAWLDESTLPRRIVVALRLEPVSSGGQSVLPERTVTVTYDLTRFGEPVPGLDFESQAG